MECIRNPMEVFQHNFDAEQFNRIKASIQREIQVAKSVDTLMSKLSHILNVQCVEFADDDDLDNGDFVPGYQSAEDDCCDFLVIRCYVELDRDKMKTDSQYVEVCFFIVFNDVKQSGWIDAASLATTDNPKDYAKEICFFDLETHRPISWCGDYKKYNQD